MGVGLAAVLVATGAIALGANPAVADGMCGDDGTQSVAGDQVTCTFTDTTRPLTFQLPSGVSSVDVTAVGGGGGDGFGTGHGSGADGGSAFATLTNPVLYLFIGGVGETPNQGCTDQEVLGGLSGSDDFESSSASGGGGGGKGDATYCSGGGGGGGTFVLRNAEDTPTTADPLLVAGGGGGGGGGGAAAGANGGKGGGPAGSSENGSGSFGGDSGDNGGNGGPAAGDGSPGSGGHGAAAAQSLGGGGGGGGGYLGGGGGGPGSGGGGGCGFQPTDESHCSQGVSDIASNKSSNFHAAAVGDGSVTVTFTLSNGSSPTNPTIPPPTNPANPDTGGHHNGNDPNPNTNPAQISGNEVGRTATASCNPRIGFCLVRPPAGPDSRFSIAANGGASKATLFGTLMGGSKPDCPNYTELNADWVTFGFRNALAGSTWHKTGTLTTRHKLSRDKAIALSRKMQICFEAQYRFLTRNGYQLGGHNGFFDGVLPECAALGAAEKRAAAPCVQARKLVSRKGGWVVRFVFQVPANSRDPKALG